MNSKAVDRNVWAVTLSLCLGVIGYSTLSAQAAEDFKLRLEANGEKLGRIEALLGRVESSKLIMQADSEGFGNSIHEYAEAMNAAADTALKEAEKAFQGKGGNANLLGDFERTAKAHATRVKQIEARTIQIDALLKVGTIKLDKPLLQKMSPQERGEFKQYLRPEGLKEMERLHPDLFKDLRSSAIKPGTAAASADRGYAAQGWCGALLETVDNLLVSPAQAEIVAQTATCIANCIAKGIADKNQAWQVYVACRNDAGACWKPWTWPKKAWCLAVYIAKLA
jgi:hypothetical protein